MLVPTLTFLTFKVFYMHREIYNNEGKEKKKVEYIDNIELYVVLLVVSVVVETLIVNH